MLRFATDEDFDNNILRGVLRRQAEIDIIRIQDTHLIGAPDPDILAWAAQENRILLTHDVNTMTKHAYRRIESGLLVTGIIAVPQKLPIGIAIEDILTIFECASAEDLANQVLYLPL